jgi:cardiolipin synthase C
MGHRSRTRCKGSAAGSGDSNIALLDTGREAFLWRVALIEAATCSIDAQYYIWNSDDSGRYVAARLLAAADRGVHVRLLLDDINVAGRDGVLAALDRHPNVEVQIYNPATGTGRGRQGIQFPARVHPPEPPHAQQVVHR